MSNIERITITVTSDMALSVRAAVEAGEYASSSEIIREALRDWKHRRVLRQQEIESLRKDVALGLDDIESGRLSNYDPERIIKKGKERLASSDS